jgi:predicted metal-dependent peptidase
VSAATLSPAITRARLQLMLGHPYLAGAVARLPLIDASDSPWCETAATDGYCIFINPAWIGELAEDEISTVLAHETLHCLLGHLDRRGDREPRLWNIAIDYATNGLLVASGMTMPGSGLHDRSLDGMTAEDIYDALLRPGRAGALSKSGSSDESAGGGWDLHLDPSDVRGALYRPNDYPTALERARLRAELASELKSRIAGTQAGYFNAELNATESRQIQWEALLARFVSGLRRSDYRLSPPNRKHLWRGLYLPALGAPGPQHLVLAIDTSGSMSDELLSSIIGEIDHLRSMSECRLTILQCDTRICSESTFESHEPASLDAHGKVRVHGRGGTDLKPPFDWVSSKISEGEPIDALIYFTDGYGPAPVEEPYFEVMWVIPSTGRVPADWGAVLQIDDRKRR